jgi:LEA14-like dessication related protein
MAATAPRESPDLYRRRIALRNMRRGGWLLLGFISVWLTACASLQVKDPLQVTVAGIEPLQGQGLELRMMVKLRIQNPNDAAVAYNGVALDMDVQGKRFASGVSDDSGSVPRFGETVINVPITISAFSMVRQAMGMMSGGGPSKIQYEMNGKLSGSTFGTNRFSSNGEFDLSAAAAGPN